MKVDLTHAQIAALRAAANVLLCGDKADLEAAGLQDGREQRALWNAQEKLTRAASGKKD